MGFELAWGYFSDKTVDSQAEMLSWQQALCKCGSRRGRWDVTCSEGATAMAKRKTLFGVLRLTITDRKTLDMFLRVQLPAPM